MAAKRIDLVGHQFGLLTVRSFIGLNARRQSMYVCECACGQFTTVRGTDLTMLKIRKCSRGCTYEPPRIRVTFNTMGQRGVTETKIG
jgi:hypothetical protein